MKGLLHLRGPGCAAAALAGLLCSAALAQTIEPRPSEPPAAPPAPVPSASRATWDLQRSHSNLSAGLPDGEMVDLRGAITRDNGDVLQLELLRERKFGEIGGVGAGAYTFQLSDRWYLVQSVALGVGGPNWAIARSDTQVSRKWLSQAQLVTSAAVYAAVLHHDRSEGGLRLAAAWYLQAPAVLEAGVVLNLAQPGSVFSHMPYASMTVGREGTGYFSLRMARGTEAYQALGAQAQLVGFRSSGVMATARAWIGPRWGLSALAERYANPSYKRRTLGVGVFVNY